MSDSLAAMTAAPMELVVDGRSYRFSPLTFADLGEMEAWVNRQIPDPKALAREMIEGMPESVAEKIALEAFRVARAGPVRLNSPEAGPILVSPDGIAQMLLLSLRKRHERLEAADVKALMDRITAADLEKIQAFVQGDDADPKPAAPAGRGTNPGRRGRKSSSR